MSPHRWHDETLVAAERPIARRAARHPSGKPNLDALESRFVGPRRVGLFGHRAVGKTTLLAMLYREASSGRIPGVRLAALDARGAEYLADKIAQIEAGESPAGTLSETELRLRLYRGASRIDLVLKDYQGEHISLGSQAPIQEFLADCDAVLLCLDPEGSPEPGVRRRRQQEVEQLLERYLDASESLATNRPIGVLITKYDRVLARGGPRPEEVEQLVQAYYGMTRHALQTHAPRSVLFAVSSFGAEADVDGRPPADLQPMGFEPVLTWLGEQLEQSDRDQLEWLWDLAPDDPGRLTRCVKVFEKRYPHSRRLIDYRRRLARLGRQRLARRIVQVGLAAALLAGSLAAYDTIDYQLARRYEREQPSALAVADRWDRFLARHPSLPLFWPSQWRDARARRDEWRVKAARQRAELADTPTSEIAAELGKLREQAPAQAPAILQVERTLQSREHDAQWNQILAQALLPSRPAAERLQMIQDFVHKNQQSPHLEEAVKLASKVRDELDEQTSLADREELDQLQLEAGLPDPDYLGLIDRARKFLDERPSSRYRPQVKDLLAQFGHRIDARDYESARQFELANADRNFEAQIRKYQDYLGDHRDGGAFVQEARRAIERIESRRDAHLYRLAFEHWRSHPDDVGEVARRLRDYLDANPSGRFSTAAETYVRWWESIEATRDYRVTLKRAQVDPSFTKSLAGGAPDLSVTIWVGSTKYGPSPVIPDSHRPIWNYTFPQSIRWRAGDPVTIQLTDHDWSDSVVATLHSARGDRLAMRNLSTEVRPAKERGKVSVEFSSDFAMPDLPPPPPSGSTNR